MLSLQQGALGQAERVTTFSYEGVPRTIASMRRMAREALTREQGMPLRRLVESICARVPGKDYLSEVAAIYYWCVRNIRYMRDPVHVELVKSPLVLLQKQPWDVDAGRRASAEDCESMATTIAAMIMAAGAPASFVTVTTDPRRDFHHVFAVAHVVGRKLVCDPVAGEGTREMLRRVVRSMEWRLEPVRRPGQQGWGVGQLAFSGQGLPPQMEAPWAA